MNPSIPFPRGKEISRIEKMISHSPRFTINPETEKWRIEPVRQILNPRLLPNPRQGQNMLLVFTKKKGKSWVGSESTPTRK